MGRPREAIDAAMLAAAIGIDRAVEADIGRLVARDDAPRRHLLHFGRQRLELAERLPAVVDRLISDRLEAAGAVGRAPRPCRRSAGTPRRSQREAFEFMCFLSATIMSLYSLRFGTNQEHAQACRRVDCRQGPDAIVRAMISVVIPTFNAERRWRTAWPRSCRRWSTASCRKRSWSTAARPTRPAPIAEAAGTASVDARRGRGSQLKAGANQGARRLAAVPSCRYRARARLGRRGAELHGAGRKRSGGPQAAAPSALRSTMTA